VIQNPGTGQIEYVNMAKGMFSGLVNLATVPGWDVRAVGDLTGDGYADIVVQNEASGQSMFANMHGGSFSGWGTATTGLNTDYAIRDAVDVNNDGFADLVVQQQSTGVTYYAQEGANGFVQWGNVTGSLDAHYQATGNTLLPPHTAALANDYTGDGTGDVLFQNDQTGQLAFAAMQAGVFQGLGAATGGLGNFLFGGHGDINGDGIADIVVEDPGSGQIYVGYQNGSGNGVPNWAALSNPMLGWVVDGVADINGDGFADIVIQNQSTGQTMFADMRGGQFNGWGTATTGLTTDYRVTGAVDVLNNGHADVIVQQQSTGATYYAQEGANGFVQWGVVGTGVGTHLHAV
jgi:hypothetical protein